MRLITLKTHPTATGFILHATIDQIPPELHKTLISEVQYNLNRIIEEIDKH